MGTTPSPSCTATAPCTTLTRPGLAGRRHRGRALLSSHHDGEDASVAAVFVVVAQLPSGQVSNHYPASDWDLFAAVPDVERAPIWDGHDPALAAERLREDLKSRD